MSNWIKRDSASSGSGSFIPIGIMLSPAMGAVLMSVSTVVVALNAQLLKVKN